MRESRVTDATVRFRKYDLNNASHPRLGELMADAEELIQSVCAYPVLYNASLHDYRSAERRVKAWREVAASIGLSGNNKEMSSKSNTENVLEWYFLVKVVECKLRREEGGRSLHYRETLSFLDAGVRKRERLGDTEAPEQLEAPEEQIHMRTPSASASSLKAERAFDEDELFLLSYVPALKRLTPQKRAAVKMQIQQIMFDAEFKEH
uniref:Si:zfos-128g4.2 n=1 Tax=Cyprinus carpio TaxID=7962 RepID=A0A8C2KWN8_CYPCA